MTTPADALQEANKLLKQGQQADALDKVDQYLANKPKDAQGRFLKGLILSEMNRQQDAIAVFTKLTEDYPELPEPYNNLAALYAKKGRYDEARVALETATKANPSYALAFENLGDLYLRLASESYKRAQSLGSKSPLTAQRVGDIRGRCCGDPLRRGARAVATWSVFSVASRPTTRLVTRSLCSRRCAEGRVIRR